MQLKNPDKIPSSFIVSKALSQDRQHPFVLLGPGFAPLPDWAGTIECSDPFGNKIEIVLRINLPFAVTERSLVTRNLSLIGISID